MRYADYSSLLVDKLDSVLKVTLNRPEVLNALSRVLVEELDEVLASAAHDEEVRVIVIAGAGRAFSAGHDLGSPQELEDRVARPYPDGIPGQYERTWDLNVPNLLRWRDLPKPTIAQVHGDWITAEEAEHLGLVNRVVPQDQLEEETMALAQRIALQEPFALRLAKQSLNLAQDQMAYRSGVMSSFQTYAAAIGYRSYERGEDGLTPAGVNRARDRDAVFGDHR